jgi:hypothetical protein
MLRGTTVPCIGHEVGQWCAYPDFYVIMKFSGLATTFAGVPEPVKVPYMVPGNYRIWRDSASEHHLLARNEEIAHASGCFQVACYKEEIEASLRTPSYSGYELLDLHDYLGQGGALIGLLDAFWEPKSYVGPAEFRQFNNATVPLARLKDRVYTTAETLKADGELAHLGSGRSPARVRSGRLSPVPARLWPVAVGPRALCLVARIFHWGASLQTSPNSPPRRDTSCRRAARRDHLQERMELLALSREGRCVGSIGRAGCNLLAGG